MNHYEKLSAINVNKHIEKKNNLSYLSWAWAVDQLLRQDPAATWTYGEPMHWNDTVMVFCTVTAFGKPMTAQLPVMDYRNKAIPNPDAFAVNTAMQRCLAKAIALHGLGLYIYAGEDLPEQDVRSTATAGAFESLTPELKEVVLEVAMQVADLALTDPSKAVKTFQEAVEGDNDLKVALWSRLDSKTRSIIKKNA